MKLLYPKYGINIQLEENQVNNLVVEKPEIFSEFLQELIWQLEGNEGELILSEADKILPIAKNVILISNPLMVDCNEKKIIMKLYKELSDNARNLMYEKCSELNSQIVGFLDEILNTVPYHLEADIDMDVATLLKNYNVQIATAGTQPIERLIDYLRANSLICGIRIFIALNLKQFFSQEELRQLYEFCFYEKIHLICMEGIKSDTLKNEKCVIIDKDLCIIEP